jgi:hypothetical protein
MLEQARGFSRLKLADILIKGADDPTGRLELCSQMWMVKRICIRISLRAGKTRPLARELLSSANIESHKEGQQNARSDPQRVECLVSIQL